MVFHVPFLAVRWHRDGREKTKLFPATKEHLN